MIPASIDGKLKDTFPGLGKEDRVLRAKQLHFLKMLSSLVANEYWRRTWVLQELTVAPRVQLSCGVNNLDFDMLCKIIQELSSLGDDGIFPGFTRNHRHIFHIAMLRSKWQPGQPVHMLEALQRSNVTVAREEHDKVYSLLGVCFDSGRYITNVDTKSSIDVIVRRMTETQIQTTRTLDIICLQNASGTRNKRLPSWVPDWLHIGGDPFNNRLIKYLTGQDDHPKQKPGENYWRATNNSRRNRRNVNCDGRVLIVQGRRIGPISFLSGATKGLTVTDGWKPKEDKSLLAVAKNIAKNLDPFERTQAGDIYRALTVYKALDRLDEMTTQFDDLWKPRTMDQLKKGAPTAHKWLEQHRDFRIHGETLSWWAEGRLGKWQVISQAVSWLCKNLHDFVSRMPTTKPQVEDIPNALQDDTGSINLRVGRTADAFVRVMRDGLRLMGGPLDPPKEEPESKQARKFYQNGFTGWAHPLARPNDEIYLLKGCSMPVILRPSDEKDPEYRLTFRVVGDTYVVNAMYGAAWTDRDEDLHDIYLI